MQTHTGGANERICALIWSLPVVSFMYLCGTAFFVPGWVHMVPMLRACIFCFGFTATISCFYQQIPEIGAAVSAGIFSICAFGFMPKPLHWIYWIAIAVFIVMEFRNFVKRVSWHNLLVVGTSAITLALILLPYFELSYSQPFNEARLLDGNADPDTFFHTAIAAMLRSNWALSQGLHGVWPVKYHFGSHLLMACAGKLAGLTVWESYSYVFVFFCVPLLGIMILAVAEELLPSVHTYDYPAKAFVYAFIMLGTGALVRGSLLQRFALWPSYFESESYTVSLILLLSLLSILFARCPEFPPRLRMPAICGVFAAITISKISVGFCALTVLLPWALLSEKPWRPKIRLDRWIVCALCGILFLGLFHSIKPSLVGGALQPFQFVRIRINFPGPFWRTLLLFVLLHFAFPITALLLFIAHSRIQISRGWFPDWLASGVGLAMAVGMTIILGWDIPGGSGYYFSNVSMFMALPTLLCIPQSGRFLRESWGMELRMPRWTLTTLFKMPAVLAVLGLCFYAPKALSAGSTAFLQGMRRHPSASILAGYAEKLRLIRDDPSNRDAVIYIPRSETEYWKSMDCITANFFIPSIGERPALYAWPSPKCSEDMCSPKSGSYGLCVESQKPHTDKELLAEAKRLGFRQVKIITLSGIRSLN